MNTQLLQKWLWKRYTRGQLLVIARAIAELLEEGEARTDDKETWRDFPDYEGLYEISNQRRMKRVASGQGTWEGRYWMPDDGRRRTMR